MSLFAGSVLLCPLLGTLAVLTQLFSNRNVGMYFRSLENDALENMQAECTEWFILPNVLGGNVLIPICLKAFRNQSLHTLINPPAVSHIALSKTSSLATRTLA